MSEPSILDLASMQGTDEVTAPVGQKIQMLISTASEFATARANRRAERAREAAAQSEAAQREARKQLDALYEADELIWKRVWNDQFWEAATPERIARAWEAAAAWAGDEFPAARNSIEHMRAELAERYGIDVQPVGVRGAELAALLGAAPDLQPDTDHNPVSDGAEASQPQLGTISYRIRDRQNDGAVVDTGVVHLASDEGAGVARQIAAERLAVYQREHGSSEHGFAIEVFAGGQPGVGALLHTMEAAAAEEIRQRYAAIVGGGRTEDAHAIRSGEGAAEVADVLRMERRRLREQLVAVTTGTHPTLDRAPQDDPAERQAWITEQVEAIRGRIASIGTRLQAVEADMRGEDGDLVVRWAALRYELHERWQTVTSEEAAALWEQVAGWSPGQARDRALAHLRAGIHREFDVELPRDATAEQVRQALDGKARRTEPERATTRNDADPLRRRASAERTEAQRAHDADARMQREAPDSDGAHGEQEWAEAQQVAAEQDRAAAATYEQMANSEDPLVAEAGESGATVAQSFTAGPSARRTLATRQRRRGTRSSASDRGRARTKGPGTNPELGR